MSAAPLRVMLVDDHQVVHDGIKLLLSSLDDVVVCAEAATARRGHRGRSALPDDRHGRTAVGRQRDRGDPRHPRCRPRPRC